MKNCLFAVSPYQKIFMASELGFFFLAFHFSLLSKNQCLNTCVYKWIISVPFSDTNWLKIEEKDCSWVTQET